jgi:hypothetical protein
MTEMFSRAILLTVLMAAGCATGPAPSENANFSAIISSVQGKAEIWRDGRWGQARRGQLLWEGERARTSANSRIDFHLGQYGGVLTLMPESMLEFEQLGPLTPDARAAAVIKLTEGRVIGDTLKLPANMHVVVKTLGGTFQIP